MIHELPHHHDHHHRHFHCCWKGNTFEEEASPASGTSPPTAAAADNNGGVIPHAGADGSDPVREEAETPCPTARPSALDCCPLRGVAAGGAGGSAAAATPCPNGHDIASPMLTSSSSRLSTPPVAPPAAPPAAPCPDDGKERGK